jgi:hypothetical protein
MTQAILKVGPDSDENHRFVVRRASGNPPLDQMSATRWEADGQLLGGGVRKTAIELSLGRSLLTGDQVFHVKP